MPTQIEKTHVFHVLHERSDTFMIPNPRGSGSARLFAPVGFEALISTSAGFAFSRGLPGYDVGRDTILAHAADLAAAMNVFMAADLENGFGDAPETVAETVRLAGAVGIVGGSTEDVTGRADAFIYSLEASIDRVHVAVEAVRTLPFPFAFTARSEDHLHGHNDLADTIRRLQAFRDAGADVLYAPGLKIRDEIAIIPREIGCSFNVLIGFADGNSSVAELAELGVKCISVGATLTRVVMGIFTRTAEELRIAGAFNFARDAASGAKLSGFFAPFA